MIASLRGRLLNKDDQGAVVECGGVGYGVSMSLASLARLGPTGSEVHVQVVTHLSQDALRLYAFADVEEKQTFEILIGTTGVGPRLALAVLSALSPSDLARAVAGGDKAVLTRISGIGSKTADRLLVELRDRLPEPKATVVTLTPAGVHGELVSALVNLGFKQQAAEDAARAARAALPGEPDVAALVRHALRSGVRM